ncbi:hypothetical protein EUGRSUZ_G02822 [Eucalyptus grandis]|uniref:Uncharacterized protein n=2 Tax=Eucalyptus grandis TaxID=71139 RepID=A0ACC3K7M9_EUCGR|nr:hypothetical protein EUGRSUZ_G02822 [Eucalyptus grandis]
MSRDICQWRNGELWPSVRSCRSLTYRGNVISTAEQGAWHRSSDTALLIYRTVEWTQMADTGRERERERDLCRGDREISQVMITPDLRRL